MKYKLPKTLFKKQSQKTFWSIFLIEGVLFLITSILSLISAFQLQKLVSAKEIYLPTTSLQDFLVYFIIGSFLFFLFTLYKKAGKFKEIIYKILFLVVCFGGGMAVLNLFLPVFLAICIMGILIAWWLNSQQILIHNVLMILALAGTATFFGLELSVTSIIFILLIVSVYDFVAVYKTKHMVLMAKEMIEKKVMLGFIIPKEIKGFKEKLDKVKAGGSFMVLGGGDVVFPSLLAVALVPSSLVKASIIVIFSLIGLFASYYIFNSQEKKEPIPALPPIALFCLIGYVITLLF